MARRTETVGTASILRAAHRRFLQWGYSGTSTAALADDLGITKAALYYHFTGKEALFLAVVSGYLTEVEADLAVLGPVFEGGRASTALEALASVFLVRHQASAQIQQIALQESRHLTPEGKASLSRCYHEALVDPLSRLLARAVERSWIRDSADGEPATVWIFLGLLSAFLTPGHEGGGPTAPSPLAFARLFQGALS